EPVIFAVTAILKGTRPVRFALAGDTVMVPLGEEAPLPAVGTEVRLFSSRFLDRPEPKEAGFPAFKIPVSLEVTTGQGAISCKVSSRLGVFTFSAPVTLLDSTGKKSFKEILNQVLGESAGSLAGVKEFLSVNDAGRPDDAIFVPPSELKKLRNGLHAALESWLLEAVEQKGRAELDAPGALSPPAPLQAPTDTAAFSDRSLLSPNPTPFATLDDVRKGSPALSSRAGFVVVPLPPVMMEEKEWGRSLRQLCADNPQERFALGLNNVGHVKLAEGLAGYPNCFFFVDYFLYVANRAALSYVSKRLDRLLFVYSWIEGGDNVWGPGGAPPAVVRIAKDYRPALFYSLGCYQRHALAGGKCQDGCPQDFAYGLKQGKNSFDVIVKDCVTYLIQKPKEKNHAGSLGPKNQSDR
ncbi:MAG TPA: hypothetical protein VMM82_02280, partial [Spirochaetia bacterium]|nr:hypothetical protein [Spirochaetia bacterium]